MTPLNHQATSHEFTRSDTDLNRYLIGLKAANRVAWALTHLPGEHVMTSSFGAQAAVSLHMITRLQPETPVVLIDTGYLFPETYRFIDELTQRLDLNLHVFRSRLSPAWQEARYGKRWLHGLEGINSYNNENKVEPMRRALSQLGAGTWFAGLRRDQASSRSELSVVQPAKGKGWKVHPIVDWSDQDVHRYLDRHRLPHHPLWSRGYLSIGDTHTTKPIDEYTPAEQARFFGLKRECGLHEIDIGNL
ncbi:MAG: phosphoadenylyl-sulfate reductase [bacterium]|nr:phosphoadenylyl-sulfate reductase [bacterium]